MSKAPTNRIPALDGLRAISIAFVILGHVVGTRGFPLQRWPKWLTIAELGVGVFFVISGLLITTLLMDEHERSGGISLKDFYVRRAYRIFPAAYFYVAVIAACAAAGLLVLRRGDVVHAVTYTMNYHHDRAWYLGHLWSLSVEEQFYLLWPFLLVALGIARAPWIALAGIALAPVARVAILFFWPAHAGMIGEYFPTISDGLATGCLLAVVRARLGAVPGYIAFLRSPAFWALPGVMVAAMYLCQRPALSTTVLPLVLNTSIALIIDRCVRFPGMAATRVLELRPLVWVGTLSYSLYLWQQPFTRQGLPELNWFPLNVALSLGLAVVSHYAVEKPFLALRVRRARAARAIR